MEERLGHQTRFGCSWMGNGRIGWYATLTLKPGKFLPKNGSLREFLLRTHGSNAPRVAGMIEATPTSSISGGPLADLPSLTQWWRDRVVLLGDSAHAMLPNLGQGGAAALSDAWSLAQCLEKYPTSHSALAAFQRLRGRKARTMQHLSRLYDGVFQPDSRVMARLRDLVARWIPTPLAGAFYRFLLGMA